jgi:putative spermidine/putrescine transport system substrate-binding protein
MSKIFKAFLFASFLAFPFAASADVTVASWGGAYTESQIKAYVDTYDGGTVKFENYNGGLGEIRAQVESGSVIWDVVDVLPDEAITGCDEGLFEDISAEYKNFTPAPDGTGMIEDMANSGVTNLSDCCAPQIFWTYVVFYDPDAFSGEKPSKIADFFDTAKFPGKRGVHTWANGFVQMAMVADGVKPSAVYTVLKSQTGAIDRAFAKMDTIKDDIVHWSAGSKPLELVKSGEVVMSIAYNGRVGAANLSEGENFEYIWEGQLIEQEYICLVSGSPNRDEALAWMIHASSPASQAEQAKYITYGPMRASGIDIIKAGEPWFHTGIDVMGHMPNTPELLKISVMGDPEWWSDNGAEIDERYGAWMGN